MSLFPGPGRRKRCHRLVMPPSSSSWCHRLVMPLRTSGKKRRGAGEEKRRGAGRREEEAGIPPGYPGCPHSHPGYTSLLLLLGTPLHRWSTMYRCSISRAAANRALGSNLRNVLGGGPWASLVSFSLFTFVRWDRLSFRVPLCGTIRRSDVTGVPQALAA